MWQPGNNQTLICSAAFKDNFPESCHNPFTILPPSFTIVLLELLLEVFDGHLPILIFSIGLPMSNRSSWKSEPQWKGGLY